MLYVYDTNMRAAQLRRVVHRQRYGLHTQLRHCRNVRWAQVHFNSRRFARVLSCR